jgi:hypothetical protein
MLKYQGAAVTTGQFGAYTLLGVEAVSNGYEVAWKNTSTGEYSVWSTDANGNYTDNVYMPGRGNDAAFGALETSFHQDLNGDGILILSGSGSIVSKNSLVIGNGASVEVTGPYAGSVSFASANGTLVLDDSVDFTGKITSQLGLGDVIDLRDISAGANATLSYSGNSAHGTLTVSDGTHTAHLALNGTYSLANFTVSSDGNGGTSLVDPPIPGGQSNEAQPQSAAEAPSAWLDSIDAKLALWAQQSAAAFPSSSFDSTASSSIGNPESGGVNPALLASAIAQQQQHYTGALA